MDSSETARLSVPYADVDSRLPAVMEEHGMAIVTGVLDPQDMAQLEQLLMQDLEELVDREQLEASGSSLQAAWQRVKAEGIGSWPAAGLVDLGGRGRFQDRGLPHGRFAWQCRSNGRVKHVYETLHGTADLVSSCDNAFVANSTQEEASSNKSWPHVDQNDHDTRVPCRDWTVHQGILYVWSSADSSHRSTTVIWPGSHRQPYSEYMSDPKVQRRLAEGRPHFTLISGMEAGGARDRLIKAWEEKGRRIPVPAGALLLFTSRTTHQGWSGGPRLAQPVCWEPRSRRDEQTRERKLRLAALGLPSTHWASLGLPHELSELKPPQAQAGAEDADYNNIRFPLTRRGLRSRALAPEADVEKLWQELLSPPWFEPLPAEVKALLEASITEEFKTYL